MAKQVQVEGERLPLLVGISFGTVYSSVSIISKDGKSGETIANEDGDRQIPSYVAFTSHEELCGTQAHLQAMTNPRSTIFHFRNILGKEFNDSEVQLQSKKHPFTIVKSEQVATLPVYEVTLVNEDGEEKVEMHSVIEVTAKYLKKMKDTAEYFLGSKVDGCVISIPPHFEESQKLDLLAATKEAGFEVAYPVHEPIAAVLAFESVTDQLALAQGDVAAPPCKKDKQIVVLDLGAHQFNVTVLSSHDGLYTIESSIDEADLGGISFNELLVEFVCQEFKRKTKIDIKDNRRAIQKLHKACERAKRALTRQDTAPCSVESLYDGMDYSGNINRGRFEMLAEPLYARCRETVAKALAEAGVVAENVDEVLVVGGSSRMPRFQAVMRSLFLESTTFRADVEPDEAISVGCAVQAAIITNNANVDYSVLANTKEVLNADHLTKNIGIEVAGGVFAVVIPHGTPVPVSRSIALGLSASGQTSAYLAVYEGQDEVAKKNSLLAEVVVSDLPESSGKNEKLSVEVTLTIEKDHSLHITASEKVSGQKIKVLVK
ncbi:hypothetical protein BASA50_007317 [Batrachochytrium salamandrivorans]|uniref:Uncharacterized protein n=1 Tax=Batrachochytrium salamandrivorans TaxID=1357716 RepID=A0ABQ8F7E7_9FUNG|nr:hypothetical protein BASA62_006192 [Batrachochytrium salamandrivorans]KAH6583908.1 hypothetical protein BASA60_001168 [Batrachochytrium salamandrivorans]KAH6589859.1 hypothetical protein BASA61_005465 [Batrachochytrium salamandrivorans]KAH6593507.1 hypothetical protein BASA50_007317 [Batrachochytrium salamandrivorans]KAJ1336305.1 hypothetical protein BSLG_007089 [Batrachochytrium salamandrivorans]